MISSLGPQAQNYANSLANRYDSKYEMKWHDGGSSPTFLGFLDYNTILERGIHFQSTKKIVKGSAEKYDINGSSVKTPMVPPNNLGPDLNGKDVNETRTRYDWITNYLTDSIPDIQFNLSLCNDINAIFLRNPPIVVRED
ncbi:hypothetical protein Tco_0963072 [Tanacetum coccineum]